MTDNLKKLLHDFGLLYVTINELEKQHKKEEKISLKDYDKSLGKLLPGEPVIVVKISDSGKHEIYNFSTVTDDKLKNRIDNKLKTDRKNKVSILELPEDEFYFFEAFRLGIHNLNQELPKFIYSMWIIHSYSLFENYINEILKKRFVILPQLLSVNKTLTIQELLDSKSKKDLIEKYINLEIRDLMYLPILGIIEKMRNKYGFKKLNTNFDSRITEISLIRNCLIHNGATVDNKLADAFPQKYKNKAKITIDKTYVNQTIETTRKLAYEIDMIYEKIVKPSNQIIDEFNK
jgi:hypothetical protein